jgi:hypothetical protein
MNELTLDQVPIGTLHPHPDNPRRGDVAAIAASIARRGQYKPVVVNRGTYTGRPMEILAGHHITRALESLGRDTVWVTLVDYDDEQAREVLVFDNRSSELGTYDTDALYALLNQMPDVTTVGYSPDDLSDLRLMVEQSAAQLDVVITDDAPAPKFDFNADNWGKADRRIVVLDMAIPQFVWLQERFAALGQEWDLDNNVDIVLRIVGIQTGLPVPAPEDIHDADEE